MPSSVLANAGVTPVNGSLPSGTTIEVFTKDGTPLYSYTVGSQAGEVRSPVVVGANSGMNTGNWLFAQQPVYISYSPEGVGQTIVGGTPSRRVADSTEPDSVGRLAIFAVSWVNPWCSAPLSGLADRVGCG